MEAGGVQIRNQVRRGSLLNAVETDEIEGQNHLERRETIEKKRAIRGKAAYVEKGKEGGGT